MFCFPSSSNRAAELNRSASPAPRSGQPLLHTFTNTHTHTHQRTKRVVRERLIRNYIRDTVTSLPTNWSCVCAPTQTVRVRKRERETIAFSVLNKNSSVRTTNSGRRVAVDYNYHGPQPSIGYYRIRTEEQQQHVDGAATAYPGAVRPGRHRDRNGSSRHLVSNVEMCVCVCVCRSGIYFNFHIFVGASSHRPPSTRKHDRLHRFAEMEHTNTTSKISADQQDVVVGDVVGLPNQRSRTGFVFDLVLKVFEGFRLGPCRVQMP